MCGLTKKNDRVNHFWVKCSSYFVLIEVGVSCLISCSVISYLYVSSVTVVEESHCLLVVMWFLFREVSSFSWCLGKAVLFYRGTAWPFHMIFL